MKKKEKYKIINYAVNYYREIFKRDYQFKHISLKQVKELLHTYKYSEMCEWSYCCYGLYKNCWQELYYEGNWGMTQKEVDEIIYDTFKDLSKQCRRDNRIVCCEHDGDIYVIIIARDLWFKADYLFCFTNNEQLNIFIR